MSQAGFLGKGGSGPPPIIIQGYKRITFADSPYFVQSTDYFISVDSSGGAVQIILPTTPANGTSYIIKDRVGKASTIPISISAGATTIDLAASYLLAGNFDSIQLLYELGNYEIF